MRTRTLSDTPVSTGTYKTYVLNTNDSSWNTDIDKSYTSLHVYKGMQDEVTENFKKRVAAGEIINNPMISVTRTIEFVPTLFDSTGPSPSPPAGGVVFYKDGLVLPEFHADCIPADMAMWGYYLDALQSERDYAVTQAWANVELSEAAALASLGEAPETIRWLGTIVNRAYGLLKLFSTKRALRNSLRWAAKSDKDDALDLGSDLWLELRYAFRPLVMEARQCLTALQTSIEKNSRSTARGWNRNSETDTSVFRVSHQLGYYDVTRVRSVESNYRAGVLFSINSDVNGLLAVWGLDQPFEAVWELVPFSFIIDWFFNIGSVISSWAPQASLLPLTSWITEIHTITTYDSTPGITYNHAYSYIGNPKFEVTPGYTRTMVHVKRRIPSPPRAVLPTFKLKLDVAKITDLSLIARKVYQGLSRH